MKNIVVLTGAGISAESGIKTFRGSDGLWENHKITDVATPQAWKRDPELVLRFYNERRKQIHKVNPNQAHYSLVKLESQYNVSIITQNIDDLHERAGSSQILHLHGQINKARSSKDENLVYDLEEVIMKIGDLCELGSQLRPHIVWFGEAVPMMEKAIPLLAKADIVLIIGTSLQVYPAAGLLDYAPVDSQIFVIDPNAEKLTENKNITFINDKAGQAIPFLVDNLLKST